MASQTSGSAEPAHDPKSSSDYIQFPCLPPGGALNRWSARLTKDHDFPGAQAMLYGAGVPDRETMKNAPQVGIASVWWEGNPCKYEDFSIDTRLE
ncbi:uncharacterized protein TrAtP1_005345 [Trichoderma atroviride]|uniref:uncharacterized protein n=1 Tax=Hypocrea atroviridis TaxID=63577 RepID=UPI003325F74C|nr:hypothetical protein TrAtP1_005345 [Trichoderma atroviride]